MKNTLAFLMASALLIATVGCANGPFRNLCRGKQSCDPCNAPAANPSFGYGYGETVNYGSAGTPTYVDGATSDPYVHGSNYGSATINPPVFDSYSSPSYGGTIVPQGSSGTLPAPGNGG